jgi:vitamin B12 transporter
MPVNVFVSVRTEETRRSQMSRHLARRTLVVVMLAVAVAVLDDERALAQVRDTTAVDTTRVHLAPIVVTAARVPVRSDRLGFTMSVLDAEDLRLRRPVTAAEALRGLGGTFIDEANGPGGPTIVRLRGGEEVFTQVLIDGVPINQNGGFFDMLGFSPGNLERIEVVRGPQSALYGSSAVSGVVQFLTRRGMAGPPRLFVSGEGTESTTNGGGYRGHAEIAGGSPALRYSAGAGWTYNRGIFDLPNDAKTRDASLRLDAQPSTRFDLTGVFRFTGVDAMLPVRDPGATRVPLDPTARNERDRTIAAATARFAQTDRLHHQIRASHYREDFVYDDVRDGVPQGLPFFVFDATFRLDSELRRSALEYAGDYRTGGALSDDLILSWGARIEHEALDDTTSGDFTGKVDLDRGSTAGFAELLVRPMPWLDLLAGARVDKYDGLDAAVTPRASAVVRVVPDRFSVRLAAGRAYKAPNLQDQYADNPFIVGNPDLEPETSTSVEAGADVASAGGRVAGSITVFHQRYDDLIRTVPFDETRQQNRNLGASRSRGIEWRLTVEPSATWAFGLDGTWLRTRIDDASGLSPEAFPEGEELPFRPSTVAGAWIEIEPLANVTARLRASHVGEQTVLSERFGGERVRLDGYTLAGLLLDWSVSTDWSIYGRIDNLFDASYETAFDRRGQPATAAIGFRWQN